MTGEDATLRPRGDDTDPQSSRIFELTHLART